MRTLVALAGNAPAPKRQPGGRVLPFEARRTDVRGWRLVEAVAESYGMRATSLMGPDRGRANVAVVRQLAMYLMHTHYGRLYSDVGRFFGRDRTTVSHACGVIEDLREDTAFDERVARLERELLDDAHADREAACATR